MAQHDQNLANASGSAFRADLNNALSALFTNSSGATEPSVTTAYMWWADTTADQLKLRNSDNDDWIVIQELDGTMLMEDGSASSPGLAFADDTNTGIFSPDADQIGFATAGVERLEIGDSEVVFNDPSNDVDFRVESNGNTHMLFVDAGNDRVGVGDSAPDTTLHVTNSVDNSSTLGSNAAATLLVENSSASGFANIKLANASTADNHALVYGTTTSGSLRIMNNTAERLRIDSSGRLLIGASSTRNSWNNATIGANLLQVERAGDANAAALSITANSGTTNRTSALSAAARVILGRSRGTTVGSNTLVGDGDVLGDVSFQGNDGDGFVEAAAIQCFIDNPPGSNDMPGRLVFKTTQDGSSSPDEKMRIFHTGQTHHFSTVNGLFVGSSQGAGTSNWLFRGNRNRTSNSAGGVTVFYVWSNGNVQNTNNSYAAISDVKLKENIVDATSQWDDLKALRVRKYNFIEGETHTQLGVIAQEVETVSPGLVNEITDRDEEGNDLGTVTKSVNYSVLYMKAVKALQEAMERIETLETKVAALEAG